MYDYAGGNVVEVASGVSGLVSAIVLGHRKGYGKEAFEPHNILLTTVGAGMLWAGWYGFNGGSALTSGNYHNELYQELLNSILSWYFNQL